MPPQTNQQPQSAPQAPQQGGQMDINTARASMGIATRLNEQLMQHQAPPQPQQGQPQEGEPKDPNTEEEKKEPNMTEEFTKFKTEIEGLLDSKLGDLKREIETELSKDDDQTPETTETA